MRLRFLRPAEIEVDDAIDYFDAQKEGLGDQFEDDLSATIAFVTESPLVGRSLSKHVRKFRLRKFPYNVIYALEGDELTIIAVAHHKRRPTYWRSRLRR